MLLIRNAISFGFIIANNFSNNYLSLRVIVVKLQKQNWRLLRKLFSIFPKKIRFCLSFRPWSRVDGTDSSHFLLLQTCFELLYFRNTIWNQIDYRHLLASIFYSNLFSGILCLSANNSIWLAASLVLTSYWFKLAAKNQN